VRTLPQFRDGDDTRSQPLRSGCSQAPGQIRNSRLQLDGLSPFCPMSLPLRGGKVPAGTARCPHERKEVQGYKKLTPRPEKRHFDALRQPWEEAVFSGILGLSTMRRYGKPNLAKPEFRSALQNRRSQSYA
jgi:hypothetical protein